MDHIFNTFIPRRRTNNDIRQSRSCGDIADLSYSSTSKKRVLKRALTFFGNRRPSSASFERTMNNSNSELINSVDEQLTQIKEQLAAFREQDARIRVRMNSLNSSVSELASRSSLGSPTPSECSDFSFLDDDDEVMQDEEPYVQDQAFTNEPQTFCIPTVIVTECEDLFNEPPVRVRRSVSHSSTLNYLQLPEERRHSTPSAVTSLFPQYSKPEEISTQF